ncbi:beta-lactamase family protein [bacterium]|nr:beta-lactamase family protein [bacterium]
MAGDGGTAVTPVRGGILPRLQQRCRVPASLREVTRVREGAEVEPRSVGVEPEAIPWIWRAVRGLYRSGAHPAIALCLRRQGRVLLDRSIGHQSGNAPGAPREAVKVVATPDTPFCALSASKPVTAMVMHLLDERRAIHLDDRVCDYIPDFARHGKHSITIRHLLSHRAGVPNPPANAMDPALLAQPARIVELLCDEKPVSRPGARLAYHAITSGFLLAEVARVATGRDLQTLLREEIREPLGLRGLAYGVAPEDLGRVAENAFTGTPVLPPIAGMFRRVLGLDFERVVEVSNDPRFLSGVLPSANVVATADEACRFMEMLRRGGELDGVRLFDPRTIVRATSEVSWLEPDANLVLPIRYGLGFMLGAEWFSLYGPFTPHAFGHIGFTNVVVWADPERELSAALMTSGKPLVYPEFVWLFEILRRIGAACPVTRPGGFAATTR